ncbi:SOS response-associated peptidase [Mesorhizobium sp. M8A.F.Ca.ET.207.01.1.1]|uniref:SOS response-associated peptidase n=1 Tax=Mesorhizobium sp. M8A.F.Ca.ET.207.01.1.1 TaxID=2563968 RepID=UPI00109C967F|nr:SOS response-associated peptidase [Mesorhizobium sp. M8A.F.Ca.ET.207.01.1.1]TGQ83749.1 SOS response-associated peptidase [Mesorhizobium sp. M8A.F.Ca.ET.207.01.1.1]
MCGRVHIKTNLDDMLQAFAFAQHNEDVDRAANQFPRYNGAPGLDYPLIINDVVRDAVEPVLGPVFKMMRWGFIPHFAKARTEGFKHINARAEGVATNGIFKNAYRSRRALMPVTGYFEWQDIFGTGKNKWPYAIAMADDQPFCLAAIWQTWRDRGTGEDVDSFGIVTCEPNSMMAKVHNRMPVILKREDYGRWLGDEPDPADLMKPFPSELMKMWRIDRKVGNSKHDTPDILDEVPPEDLFE